MKIAIQVQLCFSDSVVWKSDVGMAKGSTSHKHLLGAISWNPRWLVDTVPNT